ncbi:MULTISPECIES: serine/threonine protein kinase [unclassified Coleofasciculus]|uniref:serine/threonine protein kinase n=1 Tax=unclassified Coleofasciculus TaxID=2692782 RepID=UPI00187F2D51|nr:MULTISPECIES: serine/threonine-protein kinase [unclassified Coleofasciculus]MBE9128989.1 serine/threonine protein kinase [Coleofasciculus sp. LEGE 07081]MBE9151724.1 serine/threonine protein kinase [Coleofasciculus sp. LEGE 07092]
MYSTEHHIIAQRYRILNRLGQGDIDTTYKAEDLKSGQRVAIKSLSLRQMTDWKTLELFEREARILSQLNHPGIPSYLDYFHIDTPEDRNFYIIQQFVKGKSLAELVKMGWKPKEATVKRLAIEVLKVLVYLQQFTPAIIHRDIKPQNIILRKNGQVFLVDFGAVSDTYRYTITGSSTIVGTFGYMAPEQYRVQAVLSTDLYGLGATLLFLLTGKSPADFPHHQLKIKFRPYVQISSDFGDWLERMLEPAIAHRFPDAKNALAVLQGEQKLRQNPGQLFYQSPQNRIALLKTQKKLILEIKPVWRLSNSLRLFKVLTPISKLILPLLLWDIISLTLTQTLAFPSVYFNIAEGIRLNSDPNLITLITLYNWVLNGCILFLILGIVFLSIYGLIGLYSLASFLIRATSRTWIEINPESFHIKRWILGLCYWNVRGKLADINPITLSKLELPCIRKTIAVCSLKSYPRKYRLGIALTLSEQTWLVREITNFTARMR